MSRTVIFDFDGTIANTLDIVVDIYRELTNDHRHLSKEEIDELRKMPLAKLVKAIDIPLLKIPVLMSKGRKIMRERVAHAQVFSGMPEVIATLYGKGYVLHIVSSNSHDNVATFLADHGLAKYFVEVHGSVGLFNKAKILRDIATRSHITPRAVWYVGDEARDVTAAHKAGLRMAAVTWGYQHEELLKKMEPQALVSTPARLLKVLMEVHK